jgi:hypothetical protein
MAMEKRLRPYVEFAQLIGPRASFAARADPAGQALYAGAQLLEHLRTFYSQPGAPAALVASKLPALLRDTRLPADLQVPLDSTFDHLVAFGTCMLCGKRHRKTRGRR